MNAQAMVDQLNAFADANSIKEFLKLMGVKGYRQDELSCPISQWISYHTGCSVRTEDTITVYYDDYDDTVEYLTSDAVKEFIDAFDQGMFPELDADDVDDY